MKAALRIDLNYDYKVDDDLDTNDGPQDPSFELSCPPKKVEQEYLQTEELANFLRNVGSFSVQQTICGRTCTESRRRAR